MFTFEKHHGLRWTMDKLGIAFTYRGFNSSFIYYNRIKFTFVTILYYITKTD